MDSPCAAMKHLFCLKAFSWPCETEGDSGQSCGLHPQTDIWEMLQSSLCQGCDITDMSLGTGDPLPRSIVSALSCVAIPTAATWSAHSIAIAHSFTPALHCHQHKLSLMTSQDRSCRTDIYGSCIVSAKGKIRWTSEISSQPPCGTHCSGPSLYRLLDTCFIYGLGVRDDKSSPLGSNNLLISVSDSGLNQ